MESKIAPPIADDSNEYCGLYGGKGIYKLGLNYITDGDPEPIRTWSRHAVNFIIDDTLRKSPKNPFADFTKLKFLWRFKNSRQDPESDPYMGIPDNPEMLENWISQGRYDGEIMHHITLTKASSLYTLKQTGNESADSEDLKAYVSTYFCGKSHKDLGMSFPKFWESQNINALRFSLKNAVGHILNGLPPNQKIMLRRGAIPNWGALKSHLLGTKRCREDQPNILKLGNFMRFLVDPKLDNFKIQSKMVALREAMVPFLNNYTTQIDLSEGPGEIVNYKGEEEFTPMLNLLCILICSNNNRFKDLHDILDGLSRKKDVHKRDLTVEMFLSEKEFIYERIDFLNNAKREFDYTMYEKAYELAKSGTAGEFVKLLEQYSKTRSQTNRDHKNHLNLADTTSNNLFVVQKESDEWNNLEADEDILQSDDGYFYKKLNKWSKPNTGFRRNFNRGQNRSGRGAINQGGSNRNSSANQYSRGGWSTKPNNPQQSRINPQNRPRRRFDQNKRNNFRRRFDNSRRAPKYKHSRYGSLVHQNDFDEISEMLLAYIEDDEKEDDSEVTELEEELEKYSFEE